jgi:hypothetical protein
MPLPPQAIVLKRLQQIDRQNPGRFLPPFSGPGAHPDCPREPQNAEKNPQKGQAVVLVRPQYTGMRTRLWQKDDRQKITRGKMTASHTGRQAILEIRMGKTSPGLAQKKTAQARKKDYVLTKVLKSRARMPD